MEIKEMKKKFGVVIKVSLISGMIFTAVSCQDISTRYDIDTHAGGKIPQ